jgi:hypothetical protein
VYGSSMLYNGESGGLEKRVQRVQQPAVQRQGRLERTGRRGRLGVYGRYMLYDGESGEACWPGKAGYARTAFLYCTMAGSCWPCTAGSSHPEHMCPERPAG